VVEGRLYHPIREYDDIASTNSILAQNGFAQLDDTNVFTSWKAYDRSNDQTESWAYLFDYNLYLYVVAQFEDHEAARAYLSGYTDKLIASGMSGAYDPGADNRSCETRNGLLNFRYHFDEENEGTVMLTFRNQRGLSAEQCNRLISEHGLPAANLFGEIGGHDVTRYYYETVGFEGMHLTVDQPFSTMAEAEHFLDEYAAVLNEQGYYSINPEKIGSPRQFVFFNEDVTKYVGFDLHQHDGYATILFDFVSIEPSDDLMLSRRGH
jgi:hypothetical protein